MPYWEFSHLLFSLVQIYYHDAHLYETHNVLAKPERAVKFNPIIKFIVHREVFVFNILTFQPWFNHINIVFTKMLPTFYELGIGIIIGVQVIDIVDKKTISIILGIIVLSATLHEIKFSNFEINSKYEKIIGIFASLIGGVTGGISTIFGPPIILYLTALKLEKEHFVASVGVIWFCGSIILASLSSVNILTTKTSVVSFVACIPVLVGLEVGKYIRDKIHQEIFNKILMVGLFILGTNLFLRGIF